MSYKKTFQTAFSLGHHRRKHILMINDHRRGKNSIWVPHTLKKQLSIII